MLGSTSVLYEWHRLPGKVVEFPPQRSSKATWTWCWVHCAGWTQRSLLALTVLQICEIFHAGFVSTTQSNDVTQKCCTEDQHSKFSSSIQHCPSVVLLLPTEGSLLQHEALSPVLLLPLGGSWASKFLPGTVSLPLDASTKHPWEHPLAVPDVHARAGSVGCHLG